MDDIFVQVTTSMINAIFREAANQYVHNPYEPNIKPGTPDEMKMYLTSVEAEVKDEDRIKILQSTSKLLVTYMKELTAKYGWLAITIRIWDPRNPGANVVNIFTSMSFLKLEDVKKQAYRF